MTEPTTTEPTAGPNPGVKTTEHVMIWILSLVAGGAGLQDGNPTVRAASLIALAILGGCYALARGKAKGGAA